jgi:hypothetical protein
LTKQIEARIAGDSAIRTQTPEEKKLSEEEREKKLQKKITEEIKARQKIN